MKAFMLLLLFIVLLPHLTEAQKNEYRINVGVNSYFSPEINTVLIKGDHLRIPNILSFRNFDQIIEGNGTIEKTVGLGIQMDFEFKRRLSSRWKIDFALGFNSIHYNYDTRVEIPNEEPIYLSEIDHAFGEVNLYAIQTRLANFSYSILFQKLNIQFGLVYNIFVAHTNNKDYTAYHDENGLIESDKAVYYQDVSIGNFAPGFHFKAEYKISSKLWVYCSGQYYGFFFDKSTYYIGIQGVYAQVGLSYQVLGKSE